MHLTDDMIDAAWECRREAENDCCYEAMDELLKKVHIYRCKGCGGSRKFFSEQLKVWTGCLDCNGHGWVIHA